MKQIPDEQIFSQLAALFCLALGASLIALAEILLPRSGCLGSLLLWAFFLFALVSAMIYRGKI